MITLFVARKPAAPMTDREYIAAKCRTRPLPPADLGMVSFARPALRVSDAAVIPAPTGFVTRVDSEFPLLDGEVVEKDVVTSLVRPDSGVPAGTPVLQRTTNFAETWYLLYDVALPGAPARLTEAQPGPVANPSILVTIAGSIATGLISGVAGKLGAMMIGALLPESLPSYFDQVYAELTKIVQKAITDNTIAEINGRLTGTLQFLNHSYNPARQSGRMPKKELFDMLTPYVTTLNTEAIGPLMTTAFAQPGLSVFLLAGGIQLGLFQEQAMVDPDNPTGDPSQSTFATTVTLSAKQYAEFAQSTWNDIRAARLASVTVNTNQQCRYVPAARIIVCSDVYQACDSFSAWNGPDQNSRGQAENDEQAHKDDVTRTLASDLGDPPTIISQWRTLITSPIPILKTAEKERELLTTH